MRRRTVFHGGSRPRHHVALGLVVSLGIAGACGEPPPPADEPEDVSCGAIGCGSLEPSLVALPVLVDATALATTTWLSTLEERCRAVVDGLGGTIEGGPVDEPLPARVERACVAARVAVFDADPELVIPGDEADVDELASLAAFEDCLTLCSCDECPFTEPRCASPGGRDAGTCGGRCVGWCASREAPVACEGRCDGRCTGRCMPDPGTAPPGEGVDVDGAPCAETCSGTCDGACEHESFHDLACEGTCVGTCVGGAMQDPLCHGLEVDDLARCGCHGTCSRLVHAMGAGVGPWAHDASGAISDELARTIVDLTRVCARGSSLEDALAVHRFGTDDMAEVGAQATTTCADELRATIDETIDAIAAARTACTFTLREATKTR